MEEAERQFKQQHRIYCSGRSPVKGVPSESVHCHTQAWTRYKVLVEKYQEGH
jgi:hypothetical protein